LAWQLQNRAAPRQAEPREIARAVRVIEVQPTRFVPRALGYGYVQPGSVWKAVAEVAGKIVFRHPELERGRLMAAGAEILRIDPADYELAIARLEANLESVEAELAELAARRANTQSSLEIERRALTLAAEDLARKRKLLERGNASQATVDQAESGSLAQRQRVQERKNTLNLLPAERRLLNAKRALRDAQLREARLDLERTVIRLPFDARIAEVTVEATQFVNVGQTLAVADSIDVAEIAAQLAIGQVAPLIRGHADLSALSTEQLSRLPGQLGLSAEVRLRSGEVSATWDARFDRLSETIDPQTRTLGLIVVVEQPYRKAIPGIRPPLTKNMYVEVELRGPAQEDRIVVPRVAVHRGPDGEALVYLAGPDDRLIFRPVRAGPAQSDLVVIEEGLAGGERLVASDLIPAIEGMLLDPVVDARLAARLLAEARGEAPIR
jgi:multidrug efflux pump subunit AcrA (membrane-fusion protein)